MNDMIVYYYIVINRRMLMEDENKVGCFSQTWQSEGRFKHDWSQTFKDSHTFENRIKILEMERQKKVKDIERKLETHKKNVQIKIIKSQRKRAVKNKDTEEKENVTMDHSRFQVQRKFRENNIKSIRNEVTLHKKKEFEIVKQQSQAIEQKIKEERFQELQEKIRKRNKVRMMEIESKRNLVSKWAKRIQQMKVDRVKLNNKKLKEHQENLFSIAKYQKKQRKILDEIFHVQEIENGLTDMIQSESVMAGQELQRIYSHKA